MTKDDFLKYPGFILAISTWIAGFIVFVSDNGEWIGSFWAGGLLAGCVWVSYVAIRWLVQAFRS
jgi:hypothetical protein